jgi:hypothetical protein
MQVENLRRGGGSFPSQVQQGTSFSDGGRRHENAQETVPRTIMPQLMKAKPWPNNLGWDVGLNAEVWRLESGLGVCIFTEDCKIKHLFITDLSLDPVSAVERCKVEGIIEEE